MQPSAKRLRHHTVEVLVDYGFMADEGRAPFQRDLGYGDGAPLLHVAVVAPERKAEGGDSPVVLLEILLPYWG